MSAKTFSDAIAAYPSYLSTMSAEDFALVCPMDWSGSDWDREQISKFQEIWEIEEMIRFYSITKLKTVC